MHGFVNCLFLLFRSTFALFEKPVTKYGSLKTYRFSLPKQSLRIEPCYKQSDFTYKNVMVDVRSCQGKNNKKCNSISNAIR